MSPRRTNNPDAARLFFQKSLKVFIIEIYPQTLLGSIQISLLFSVVFSFAGNSQGKLVKMDLKVTRFIATSPKLKNIMLESLFLLMFLIEVEMPLVP